VLLQNDTFGDWQRPTEILIARFVKFSVPVRLLRSGWAREAGHGESGGE
jgi:hypothetical protein